MAKLIWRRRLHWRSLGLQTIRWLAWLPKMKTTWLPNQSQSLTTEEGLVCELYDHWFDNGHGWDWGVGKKAHSRRDRPCVLPSSLNMFLLPLFSLFQIICIFYLHTASTGIRGYVALHEVGHNDFREGEEGIWQRRLHQGKEIIEHLAKASKDQILKTRGSLEVAKSTTREVDTSNEAV